MKELKNKKIPSDIKLLIAQSRQNVALAVNAEITLLYWKVGKSINDEVLGNERALFGKQIVSSLSTQLEAEYGKGWGEKQLRQCMQFASVFADEQIAYTLFRQLSWSHLRLIMFMEDPLKREFYIEMCKLEKGLPANYKKEFNLCFTNVQQSAKSLTVLPSLKMLQEKLHKAVEIAQQKIMTNNNM